MTSSVTKAMIESYALMVLVMGTFFVYFCGMVWAFCNPKLSGADEECVDGTHAAEPEDADWVRAPNPPKQIPRCSCAHQGHTQNTYVNFWGDTDSLISDGTAFCRDEQGVNNQFGYSPSWSARDEQLMP